jgi:hypothetical protein
MLFVAAAGFVSKSADVQVTGRGGGVDLLIKSLAPFLSNWRGGFAHQILGAIFVKLAGWICSSNPWRHFCSKWGFLQVSRCSGD